MASAFPTNISFFGTLSLRIAKVIEESTKGEIEMEVFPPGALVNAFEVFDAVSKGVIDAGWATSAYWQSKEPAFAFFSTTMFRFTPEEHIDWMEQEGIRALNELYEPYNIISVPCGMVGPEGGGWFLREIRNPNDLKGLKMRFFGLGAKVAQRVGVNTFLLAGADLFPALERGVIDATEFSIPTIDLEMGFYRLTKNYYYPSWHQPYLMLELIFNKYVWKEISKDDQRIIEQACAENVRYGLEQSGLSDAKALEALAREHGVKILRFPETVLETLQKQHGEIIAEIARVDEKANHILEIQKLFHVNYQGTGPIVSGGEDPGLSVAKDWSITILDTDFVTVSPAYTRAVPRLSAKRVLRLALGTEIHVIRQLVNPETKEVWYQLEINNEIVYAYSKNFESLRRDLEFAGKGATVVDAPASASAFQIFSRKRAIVIGVSDYQYLKAHSETPGELIDLKYADKDARAFADFLKNDPRSGGGWEVYEFIGPGATTEKIYRTIGKILATSFPSDLIYLYFSGHGASNEFNPSDVYLMTYDTHPNRLYSGLYYTNLRSQIVRASAKHITFFIDACRSGIVGFGKGGSVTPAFDQDELGKKANEFPDQKTIFSSGQSVQASWEDPDLGYGLFTYYLLKGLRGEAATLASPGFIDLGEIVNYVILKVSYHSEQHDRMALQTPRLWTGSGVVHDRFPVALDQ